MADNNKNIGVITEQGDLGLGFNKITEEEKKKLKQQESKNDKSNSK